jgi:hypothetical protein
MDTPVGKLKSAAATMFGEAGFVHWGLFIVDRAYAEVGQ